MCLEAEWDMVTSLKTAVRHTLILMIVGKALPLLVAFYVEGQARLQFLRAR